MVARVTVTTAINAAGGGKAKIVDYQWVKGSRFSGVQEARATGKYLRQAGAHLPGLTPEDVVKAARPASSPIHAYFEWNNTKAARAYRLEQAAYLLRSINAVVKIVGKVQSEVTRAYVSLTDVGRHAKDDYKEIDFVLNNKAALAKLLQRAIDEMQVFVNKYHHLVALAPAIRIMRQLIKKLRKVAKPKKRSKKSAKKRAKKKSAKKKKKGKKKP